MEWDQVLSGGSVLAFSSAKSATVRDPSEILLLKIFRTIAIGVVCGLAATISVSGQEVTAHQESSTTIKDAAKAMSAGNLQRAEVELRQVLAASPRDFRALNLMGILRAQQGRENEAEVLFKQVIEIKPDFAGAYASLGLLYVQVGRKEEAIPQLREALRLEPFRIEVRDSLIGLLRTEARDAVGVQDPEKALAALLQAREVSPQDADVRYELGMVALRMSLFSDAIEAFQAVLAARPNDALALYGLGRAQISSAKFSDAKESFSRYVQERPDDPAGQYALGLALEELQQNQEARQRFQKSLALRPVQTEAYFRLGLIDLDEGRLDPADAQFSSVLERDPKHAGALTGRGQVAFQRKNYNEAVDFLMSAVANDSSLRQAHYYLGLTYARLGRKNESDQELQAASRLEHEEVEKHQRALKVLGLEESPASPPGPK